jgi:hypothetical protein
MFKTGQCRRKAWTIAAVGFILLLLPASIFAQETELEPRAVELLKASTTYLAGQASFSVDTTSTIEVVLTSGQKIQFDHTALLSLQRPNKLRAERRGDLVDQVFFFNGKTLTLFNPEERYYATVEAPDTLEEMMNFALESLDIIAPAADLLYKNAFEILMADVNIAFVVGKSVVDGVQCDHLAFRAPHVDWQIWIQDDGHPLPRKLVITTTEMEAAPQFSVVMTNWNLDPKFADGLFEFTPPEDAEGIEFLPVPVSQTVSE